VDNHFWIASRRWAPMLGLLVAISVASIELAAAQRPGCTAERAVEDFAGWLAGALSGSIHAPIHGL
jgi:hypothetical protein